MSTVQFTPEFLVAIGTVATGVAAMWAAFTAYRGLASWKTQQIWLRDSELVKRLLIALFERHDAVRQIRNPFGSISQEALSDKQKRFEETKADYEARLKLLSDARKSFYANSNEARAVWGEEIEDFSLQLLRLEAELIVVVEDHVVAKNPEGYEADDRNRDERRKDRDVLFGRDTLKDEFGQKYLKAKDNLEEFLQGKLGK